MHFMKICRVFYSLIAVVKIIFLLVVLMTFLKNNYFYFGIFYENGRPKLHAILVFLMVQMVKKNKEANLGSSNNSRLDLKSYVLVRYMNEL
eukprot:UN10775